MIEYILCYATSFTLGTMFGLYLGFKLIKYIKEKKIW
jgi:hypothetical protein